MAGGEKAGKRGMGFWTCSALVIGNMVGSGVFLLPSSLAAFGGLSLFGWLVSSTGAVLLALTFARLARVNPGAAAPTPIPATVSAASPATCAPGPTGKPPGSATRRSP